MTDAPYILQSALLLPVVLRMACKGERGRELLLLTAWWAYGVLSFTFGAESPWLHLGVFVAAIPLMTRPLVIVGVIAVALFDVLVAWLVLSFLVGVRLYANGWRHMDVVRMFMGSFFLYYATGVLAVALGSAAAWLPVIATVSALAWLALYWWLGGPQMEGRRAALPDAAVAEAEVGE